MNGHIVTVRVDTTMKEIDDILERVRSELGEEDHEKLALIVETLKLLTTELERKNMSIHQLRRLVFGPSSEKTSKVLKEDRNPREKEDVANTVSVDRVNEKAAGKKRKGHGRNGAAAYTGAQKIKVSHDTLNPGDRCPQEGCDGKVYGQQDPAVVVRIVGAAPVQGKVYELEKFRCNLCGELFSARAPEGVGEKKYDETVSAMIGCLRYGSGFPFYRLSKLQSSMGIPLPETTQWDLVRQAAMVLAPSYDALVEQAAQGELVHNDDTPMKILEIMKERMATDGSPDDGPKRKGVFTSGVISKLGERRIALFFTGHRHAGENLAEVLKHRSGGLDPPIQMCDGLSRNRPGDFEVILSNCIGHSRRCAIPLT